MCCGKAAFDPAALTFAAKPRQSKEKGESH
jgi:hypothetical protein